MNLEKEQIVAQQVDSSGALVISDNPEGEVNDIVAKIHSDLESSPEVQRITSSIDIRDQQSLSEYGSQPAVQIASFADSILRQVTKSSMEDSGELLVQLNKLMKTFDSKELSDKDPGFLSKMFGNLKKQIEKIINKYQTFGGEIDKINIQITGFKGELQNTNNSLEGLFNENLGYYQELEKYIVAGNMCLKVVKEKDLPELEQLSANSGNQMDSVKLQSMVNAIEALEDRVHQLELAKIVSLQTAPQIRMIQKGNYKLISKIQSAFIVTIPLFKIGLTQAIALKRQKIIADSMDALDKTTNELLLRNAQNSAAQSASIARMSTGSVKLETLVESWDIISKGIDETMAIEAENKKTREQSTKKLHELQTQIHNKVG